VTRAVGLALGWRGTSPAVLNIGTGKNHSVMDMVGAATKAAARKFADIAPAPIHQASHPADVPETLASRAQVGQITGRVIKLTVSQPPEVTLDDGRILVLEHT